MLRDDRARRQHYRFAHLTLRNIATEGHVDFARVARRDDFADGLTQVWNAIGEHVPIEERTAPEGLAAERLEVHGWIVVLVTMPRAEHTTEAHFVAVVMQDDSVAAYLVLEHSWTVEGTPTTVLGEWTSTGHQNLGPGPEPNRDAFLAVVEQRLGDDSAWHT